LSRWQNNQSFAKKIAKTVQNAQKPAFACEIGRFFGENAQKTALLGGFSIQVAQYRSFLCGFPQNSALFRRKIGHFAQIHRYFALSIRLGFYPHIVVYYTLRGEAKSHIQKCRSVALCSLAIFCSSVYARFVCALGH
jgi:hypothetical protein